MRPKLTWNPNLCAVLYRLDLDIIYIIIYILIWLSFQYCHLNLLCKNTAKNDVSLLRGAVIAWASSAQLGLYPNWQPASESPHWVNEVNWAPALPALWYFCSSKTTRNSHFEAARLTFSAWTFQNATPPHIAHGQLWQLWDRISITKNPGMPLNNWYFFLHAPC